MKDLRTLIVIFGLCLVAVCSAQVERRADLGDDYDAAMIAKPSKSSFESIAHREYLRYKEKEIYQLGHYELSPDKRFIAFQESNTGKVILLDKKEHTAVELVSKSPGLVRSLDWKAKAGFLKIQIYGKEALTIELPLPQKK